jgi:hypothetical protein
MSFFVRVAAGLQQCGVVTVIAGLKTLGAIQIF